MIISDIAVIINLVMAIALLAIGILAGFGGLVVLFFVKNPPLVGIPFVAAALAYIALWCAPMLVGLPLVVPIASLWKRPARFLILRPFNRGAPNRVLREIVRTHLAPLGHLYTLADRDVRIGWFATLSALGPLSLCSFRVKPVTSRTRLHRLEKALRRRWIRNLNWCLSLEKLFAVRTTPEWWQESMAILAMNADVILLDVSELRANLLWEASRCKELGLAQRLLYLVSVRSPATANEAASVLNGIIDREQTFFYAGSGILDRPSFDRVIAAMVAGASSLSPDSPDRASDRMR